jgi:hypothetical protein
MIDAIEAHPMSLSQAFFGAGPGLGGVARLDLRNERERLVLIYTPDTTDDEYPPVRVASIVRRGNWRKLVRGLLSQEIVAFYTDEWNWPDTIEMDGQISLAAELLRLAWAGSPFSNLAGELIELSDEELVAFRRSLGSLSSRRHLLRLCQMSDLLDRGFGDLAKIIRLACKVGPSLLTVWQGVRLQVELQRARENVQQREAAWNLFPYGRIIDSMVRRWLFLNPATSSTQSMGRAMRAGAVRSYLNEYIRSHGSLPSGINIVKPDQLGPFKLDFDRLKSGEVISL